MAEYRKGRLISLLTTSIPLNTLIFSQCREYTSTKALEQAGYVAACAEGASIRESARKYNVPVTTLYRRVKGLVEMGSRPGPDPVLSSAEDRLSSYLIEMANMGLGLSCQEVMHLAFQIAELNTPLGTELLGGIGSNHFGQGILISRYAPEALSYARAKSVNTRTIENFFARLFMLA